MTVSQKIDSPKVDVGCQVQSGIKTAIGEQLKQIIAQPMFSFWFVAALLIGGSIYKATSGIALVLDGSYQLMCLIQNHAAIAYHGRLGVVLPQYPSLWVFNCTDRLSPTLITFCTTYALVPLLPIAFSWALTPKERRALFVWPAIALCLTSACAQVMLVNGAMFVFMFAWPLFVGALGTITRTRLVVLLLLSIFIVSLHLSGVIYVAMTAAAVLVRWCIDIRRSTQVRYLLLLALVLVSVAACKVAAFILFPASYDLKQIAKEGNAAYLAAIIFYGPIVWIGALSILSGLFLLLSERFRPKLFSRLALACAVVTGLLSLWWSMNLGIWPQGLTYCRLMPLFFAPIMLFALIDSMTDSSKTAELEVLRSGKVPPSSKSRNLEGTRKHLVVTSAIVFCVVACTLSSCWKDLTNYIKASMAKNSEVVMTPKDLNIFWAQIVEHWSITALSVILQERRDPPHLILTVKEAPKTIETGQLRIVPWETPGTHTWFRFPDIRSGAPHR